MGLFFWKLKRPGQPEPKHKNGDEATYMIVYVDDQARAADREDGGGSEGRHMLPGEGWDVLRALYIPADGRPHKVEGEYRVEGVAGSVGPKFLIHEGLFGAGDATGGDDGAPAPSPGPRCGDDPLAYVVDRQLGHVERVTDRYHAAVIDGAERQERAMGIAIGEGRANFAVVLEMFERQAERTAARDQALFAELGATNRAALETAQRGIDAAERLASARAKGPDHVAKSAEAVLIEKGLELLPKVAMGAYGLYNAAGGLPGIVEKVQGLLGGVVGGGGGRGVQTLAESLKTFTETWGAVAMARLEAQKPAAPAPANLPAPDAADAA